jgi:hypothetical protein
MTIAAIPRLASGGLHVADGTLRNGLPVTA